MTILRRVRTSPYQGPSVPSFQRRHFLHFSTTPPPLLQIPQEIYVRLVPILQTTKDITAQVEALKKEYAESLTQRQPEVKEALETEITKIEANPPAFDLDTVTQKVVSGLEVEETWQDIQKDFLEEKTRLSNSPGGCTGCSLSALVQKTRMRIFSRYKEPNPSG